MFCRPSVLYFNPRAPCGARPADKTVLFSSFHISIHGLRVEPDEMRKEFVEHVDISIHGLRVEPDFPTATKNRLTIYFNPRAPCGARPTPSALCYRSEEFQSTGSVWSPTAAFLHESRAICISIHGLRVEPDWKAKAENVVKIISIHGLRVEPDVA